MFALHLKYNTPITGKRICEITPDNADNSDFGKCLESGHCTRSHCISICLLQYFYEFVALLGLMFLFWVLQDRPLDSNWTAFLSYLILAQETTK